MSKKEEIEEITCLTMKNLDSYLRLLEGLSNRTRFLIISMLLEHEPRRWSDFMREIKIKNKRNLWFHLHKLIDLGIVKRDETDKSWWLLPDKFEKDYIFAIVGILCRSAEK